MDTGLTLKESSDKIGQTDYKIELVVTRLTLKESSKKIADAGYKI